MANRQTLHFNHLEKFEQWLIEKGYSILPISQNPYEVLRAKKDKNTIVIYRKSGAKEHLSVMDKDYRLVQEFLKG